MNKCYVSLHKKTVYLSTNMVIQILLKSDLDIRLKVIIAKFFVETNFDMRATNTSKWQTTGTEWMILMHNMI